MQNIIYPARSIANSSIQYIEYIDEASSTVTYIGSALPNTTTSSPNFRIKKILLSGTITSVLFADGNSNFDNIWDNRASLSYS